jgi:L-aminopeptidase/D-esterase-like protein
MAVKWVEGARGGGGGGVGRGSRERGEGLEEALVVVVELGNVYIIPRE